MDKWIWYGVVGMVLGIALAIRYSRGHSAESSQTLSAAEQRPSTANQGGVPQRVSLEQQVEQLAGVGLKLNEGVTIDDLLYSWNREDYEEKPFDMLLFMLGAEVEREPWGRRICDSAWNFDTECIEGTGSYVEIVENLTRVAGMPGLITDATDFVDIDKGEAWLKYTIDGKQRHFTIAVDNDWADPATVGAVMKDIERDGKRFVGKDNGQATIWFYLDASTVDQINKLSGNALRVGE